MKKSYDEDIDFVFEQNPELEKIGTKKDYSEYLKTIFPESKIKGIFYHGTISKNLIEKFNHKIKFNKKGVTYLGELDQAKKYINLRGKIYPVIVNSLNPYIQKPLPEDNWATDNLTKEEIQSFKDEGYDSIVGEGIFGDAEKIIFNPSQIKILGSKKDKKDFYKFVNANKKDYLEEKKNRSLEKIISGIFILSFLAGLFLSSGNLTGNVVGGSGTAHKLLGIILVLVGMGGFFVYRKLK